MRSFQAWPQENEVLIEKIAKKSYLQRLLGEGNALGNLRKITIQACVRPGFKFMLVPVRVWF